LAAAALSGGRGSPYGGPAAIRCARRAAAPVRGLRWVGGRRPQRRPRQPLWRTGCYSLR